MPVLFISRGTVSGVRILVDRLRECEGLTCLSREDLVKEVSRYGDWATTAVEQLSKATSAYEHFSRIRRPYVVLMRQALLEKIRRDNVVYCGFSGHLLVPRLKHFVRVRINAPLNLRIAMTMERLNCDEDHACEYIHDSDEQQVKWARFVYGHDIRDPALYDLNINLGHLTMDTVRNIIEHIMLETDLQVSGEVSVQVERLLLAANVEAALIIDPRTREMEIDAEAEDGCVRLCGPYLEDATLATVTEIARAVHNVGKVEYEPGYASQHRLEEHEGTVRLKH